MPAPQNPKHNLATQNLAQNLPQDLEDLRSLQARLKLLRSPTFTLRYIMRNIDKATQACLTLNLKSSIKAHPLRALYLLPLLIARKALYKIECFGKTYRAKVLATPSQATPKSALLKILRLPLLVLQKLGLAVLTPLSSLMWVRVYARFLLGKVDMPYFELVLTTRCSLRCESCNNLMQYFERSNAYTCTINGISHTLEALLAKVDSIYWVRIIGGEPLLFKDIDKVVKILDSSKKVKSFDIVTNATLLPSPKLLDALQASHKCFVSISDYTKSPNLRQKLHIQKLRDLLASAGIAHAILWQDESSAWIAPGKIYKRGRDKQGIVENFLACQMPCVSIMSHEGLPPQRSSADSSKDCRADSVDSSADCLAEASAGEIFICPIASSLSRLKGLEEFLGDFVSLDLACNKYDILRFYAKEFFKACDYCHDMAAPKRAIPIAVQTTATLTLTP